MSVFAPLRFLGNAASELSVKRRQYRRLVRHDIPLLSDVLLHTKILRWKSDFLRKGAGITPERAETIVDAIFYDSRARREVKRQIDKMGGMGGVAFWDVYLRRCHHAVMGFSDGYLSLLQLASQTLPTEGDVMDWNSGTGNLACALLLACPDRRVFAADSNPRAVIATKRMLKHFFPGGRNYFAKVGDPLDPAFTPPKSTGAVVHNVLYLLDSDKNKVDFLSGVARALNKDGLLFLVEPKPSLQKQSMLRLWIHRIVKSATLSHSPVNEFDIAFFTEVQLRLFTGSASSFSNTRQLMALCEKAGFAVHLVRDALYGHCSVLVLRKLPEKKKAVREPVIRYHDDPMPSDSKVE